MEKITISATTTANGFIVTANGKKTTTTYPKNVWASVPDHIRTLIAEASAYNFTHHLAVEKNVFLYYDFPPPPTRLFMDYGFFYSMIEAPVEFPEKHFTVPDVLRRVYNAEFSQQFSCPVRSIQQIQPERLNQNTVVIPMSFGKDSLLTFSLLREMGVQTHPVFFEEPTATFNNLKKQTLRKAFAKEFNTYVHVFPNALGALRDKGGQMWGWDMLLLQYTVLLLPYVFYHKPMYFFWSNEKSTDEFAKTKDEYFVNYSHEQSVSWLLHLSNVYRSLQCNTTIATLLEPVHELIILSMLHTRYPEIGKYQLSCDGEKSAHRWCGKCNECARVYLFLVALGIDPKRVDLADNMFDPKKRDLFYLFTPQDKNLTLIFQSQPERLLSFYLAYKRGIRGGVMNDFIKMYLPMVEKQKHQLMKKYFTVYPSLSMPDSYKAKAYRLYHEELKRLRKAF